MQTMYALVDCNNFFVSCERLFRPDLDGRPVVVLSSNDGCAVSRSQEAKDLGIPMGAPLFKWRDLWKQHGVVAFSANFELYGDISERIVNLLTTITPRIEAYSVDESFLDLTELSIGNYTAWGKLVRESILRNIGVPVSVGIAPSKTLTKLANHAAKRTPELGGALTLTGQDSHSQEYLRTTDVRDLWGVGWRLGPKLKAAGIHTALDLARTSPRHARQLMGIHGRQMVYELNGTCCLPLQSAYKPQQMVMRGRQFGEDTHDLQVITAAVASLTARAAAQLRREQLLARQAVVILRTNRLKPGYQRVHHGVQLRTPTADTGLICRQLIYLLQRDFTSHLEYHKADVLLYDLVPAASLQTDLLGLVDVAGSERSRHRMAALDALNARHGKGVVRYASEDLSRAWQPRRRMSSPRYTSAWSDLPEVKLV